ncbi:hypothetical protein EGX84_18210 [Acinetobacter baumannii]|nr:hypothetical protein EGX84_18210 [Acinetobacter baumannii]
MMTTQPKNTQTFIIGVLSALVVVLAGWLGYDKLLKPKSETIVTASVSEPATTSEPMGMATSESEPYRVCRRVNILRDYPDDKTKLYPRN